MTQKKQSPRHNVPPMCTRCRWRMFWECLMIQITQLTPPTCLETNPGIVAVYCTIHIHIHNLVQDCSNSSALAMELLHSCTKPSTYLFWTSSMINDSKETVTRTQCPFNVYKVLLTNVLRMFNDPNNTAYSTAMRPVSSMCVLLAM